MAAEYLKIKGEARKILTWESKTSSQEEVGFPTVNGVSFQSIPAAKRERERESA